MKLLKTLIKGYPVRNEDVLEKLEKQLQNATPETQKFAMSVMRDIMASTRRRKNSIWGGWWHDLNGPNKELPEKALNSLVKVPVVKGFLESNGISIQTRSYNTTYRITAAPNPPEGTYGHMLQEMHDAYKKKNYPRAFVEDEDLTDSEKKLISDLENPSL